MGLCVIDAVYSIGVRYESTRRTVSDFCRWAHWEEDLAKAPSEYTISEFVALLEPYNGKWEEMADEVFYNRQRTSTRGGILKAEAVFKSKTLFQQPAKSVGTCRSKADTRWDRTRPLKRAAFAQNQSETACHPNLVT